MVRRMRGTSASRLAGLMLLAGAATALSAADLRAQPDAVNNQTPEINRLLAKAWADNGVKPSARCTDYEFIRRASLDLIGRIAYPEEVKAFEADSSADKRAKLVRKLLWDKNYTDNYADHWADLWTVWLMTRGGLNPSYHDAMRLWLTQQFEKNVPHDQLVTKVLTATGVSHKNAEGGKALPVDSTPVLFVLSHMGEAAKAGDEGKFEAIPVTSRTTRLFLGLQTQCIQCHDHPFNPEWKQQQFWGVNAFFRQIDRDKTPTPAEVRRQQKGQPAVEVSLSDNASLNPSGIVGFERRNGVVQLTRTNFLETDPKKIDRTKPRREELARLVVANEQFGKAYVNRIWGHLFGRGMNEQRAVDDFGEHNKVVHPELLDFLAKEFVAYKYDSKQLLYWICTSDAYSLSCVANPTNAKEEHEPFFARMLLKALTPETLHASLVVATTPRDPKKRSAEERQKAIEEKLEARKAWMSKLVQNFGDDEGNEVTFNGTIIQALLMMNGKDINESINGAAVGERTTVAAILTRHKGHAAICHELFLAALNRRPTNRELADLQTIMNGGTPASAIPKEKPKPAPKGTSPSIPTDARDARGLAQDIASLKNPVAFYEDVFWALLNTNEFILNH